MKALMAMCCNKPLVPTLMFSYAEFYCLHCKSTYGMLEAPQSVEVTEELNDIRTAQKKQFQELSKDCVPRGCKFQKCEQCQKGGYHSEHMTDEERRASDAAYQKLHDTNVSS